MGVRESEESGWGFPMRVIRKPWTEVRNARVGDGFLVELSGGLSAGVFRADSLDFPGGPLAKNPPCNTADTSSISGPGRSHTPRGS